MTETADGPGVRFIPASSPSAEARSIIHCVDASHFPPRARMTFAAWMQEPAWVLCNCGERIAMLPRPMTGGDPYEPLELAWKAHRLAVGAGSAQQRVNPRVNGRTDFNPSVRR